MASETIDEQVRRLLLVEHFDERARDKVKALGDDAFAAVQRHAEGSSRGEAGFLKARAIVVLGDWDRADAVETLTTVLVDRHLDSRLRAADSLGRIGTDPAITALRNRAATADAGVEVATLARSLARIDRPEAQAALSELRAAVEDTEQLRQVDDAIADLAGS